MGLPFCWPLLRLGWAAGVEAARRQAWPIQRQKRLRQGGLGARSLGLIGSVTHSLLEPKRRCLRMRISASSWAMRASLAGFALLGGTKDGAVIVGLLSSLPEQRPIRAMRARTRRKRLEEVRGVRASRRRVRRGLRGAEERAGHGRENSRRHVQQRRARRIGLSGRSSRRSNPFDWLPAATTTPPVEGRRRRSRDTANQVLE